MKAISTILRPMAHMLRISSAMALLGNSPLSAASLFAPDQPFSPIPAATGAVPETASPLSRLHVPAKARVRLPDDGAGLPFMVTRGAEPGMRDVQSGLALLRLFAGAGSGGVRNGRMMILGTDAKGRVSLYFLQLRDWKWSASELSGFPRGLPAAAMLATRPVFLPPPGD